MSLVECHSVLWSISTVSQERHKGWFSLSILALNKPLV
ncbi:Uncharacterised protein [Vibrio cholerae]|nr:Uncharacterised protein [Vibrio cholerae]